MKQQDYKELGLSFLLQLVGRELTVAMAILNVSDVLSIPPLTVLSRLTSQTVRAYQVSRATLQSVKIVQELDLNNFADIPT